MIVLDGKKLAEKIKEELKTEYQKLGRIATLAIIQTGSDRACEKFIEQKKKIGEELGVNILVRQYKDTISGAALRKRLAEVAHDTSVHGIVIQMPLPKGIQAQDILNAVPPAKDVDVLSARAIGDFATGKSKMLSPVVGAIDALFQEYGIEYQNKKIIIVGAGRLVGKPVSDWLSRQGIGYCLLTDKVADISQYTKEADILIAGAGKPKLITGDILKDGAVIIDAGTSESEGRIMGDVDFDSAVAKASHITPVPGGIGPLTVVMVFKNLLRLIKHSRKI